MECKGSNEPVDLSICDGPRPIPAGFSKLSIAIRVLEPGVKGEHREREKIGGGDFHIRCAACRGRFEPSASLIAFLLPSAENLCRARARLGYDLDLITT